MKEKCKTCDRKENCEILLAEADGAEMSNVDLIALLDDGTPWQEITLAVPRKLYPDELLQEMYDNEGQKPEVPIDEKFVALFLTALGIRACFEAPDEVKEKGAIMAQKVCEIHHNECEQPPFQLRYAKAKIPGSLFRVMTKQESKEEFGLSEEDRVITVGMLGVTVMAYAPEKTMFGSLAFATALVQYERERAELN